MPRSTRVRIIHDVDRRFQAGGACIPFDVRPGHEKSHGFRVEFVLTPKNPDSSDPYGGIHIHGNARHVLSVLNEAASMIEEVAGELVASGKLDEGWNKDL
jgi:hypothetical protein